MKHFNSILLLSIFLFNFSCAGAQERPIHSGADISEQTRQTDSEDSTVYSGKVVEQKSNPGTLSEYSWFVLQTDNENLILFNSKGYSAGFGEWTGSFVEIEGVRGVGKMGLKKTTAQGLIVQSIKSR